MEWLGIECQAAIPSVPPNCILNSQIILHAQIAPLSSQLFSLPPISPSTPKLLPCHPDQPKSGRGASQGGGVPLCACSCCPCRTSCLSVPRSSPHQALQLMGRGKRELGGARQLWGLMCGWIWVHRGGTSCKELRRCREGDYSMLPLLLG